MAVTDCRIYSVDPAISLSSVLDKYNQTERWALVRVPFITQIVWQNKRSKRCCIDNTSNDRSNRFIDYIAMRLEFLRFLWKCDFDILILLVNLGPWTRFAAKFTAFMVTEGVLEKWLDLYSVELEITHVLVYKKYGSMGERESPGDSLNFKIIVFGRLFLFLKEFLANTFCYQAESHDDHYPEKRNF